ncbi:MAG: hypothetical protein ABW166_02870 [Sedimenticola sp.]
MEKRYIAEVFVPTQGSNGKKGKIGTASPVGADLLLTAYHVLHPGNRDEAPPIQIRYSVLGTKGSKWQDIDEIVWKGNKALDAALIKIQYPVELKSWG